MLFSHGKESEFVIKMDDIILCFLYCGEYSYLVNNIYSGMIMFLVC